MSLGGYEIALLCTIAFNLIFWVSVICWRLVIIPMCIRKDESSPMTSASQDESGVPTISAMCVEDAPPPYEEALKYPTPRQSLSMVNVDMSTGEITPIHTSIHSYDLLDINSQTTYLSLSTECLAPEQQESNS